MRRVLFVTGTESPFQVELAEAINSLGEFEYTVAFDEAGLGDRGAHWRVERHVAGVARYRGEEFDGSIEEWTTKLVGAVEPNAIIVGGVRGARFERAVRLTQGNEALLGVFAEQPRPVSRVVRRLYEYRVVPRFRSKVKFVLAVGDRAVECYSRWTGRPQDVNWFPYYERLQKQQERRSHDPAVRFLFSGRLIPRNRVENVLVALATLVESGTDAVELCISGSGESEAKLRSLEESYACLKGKVRYENNFNTWEERLKPFRASDVLVVPAEHSGWGLVVPEALAMGLAVITTRGVEAARHMVRHWENGLLCDGSIAALAEAMGTLARDRKALHRLQRGAAGSVDEYDVDVGARRFGEIMNRYLR